MDTLTPALWTDRQIDNWKHYIPATSLAGGNNILAGEIKCVSVLSNMNFQVGKMYKDSPIVAERLSWVVGELINWGVTK